jgi:hypothetical protein
VTDVSEDQPKTVIERMVSAGINRDPGGSANR